MDISRKLNSAKINLSFDKKTMFYSAVLFGLKTKVTDEVPTAAVDGTTLFINPDWFSKLTLKAAVGLLAHEVMHVVSDHLTRRIGLDPKIHNYAADYKINGELDNAGIHLPAPCLLDHKYDSYTLMGIYDELHAQQPDYPEIPLDIMEYDPAKEPAKEMAIKVLITQAALSCKSSGGKVPHEVERYISSMLAPPIDWDSALMEYMQDFLPTDYSWAKPNRSYMPDLFLPGLAGNKLGEIAFAIDSSGSVSEDEFSSFIAAVEDCRELLQPEKTTVLDFTTQINNIYELESSDYMSDVKFDGWGGTDLHPVIEYFNERPPVVLVVFSDLECCPIEKEPDYPVLWVCINNPEAHVNFGKIIHYTT